VHNQLDEQKMKYIIAMRKDLCKENICFKDGSLNLKYFNVKKGHYWSKNENDQLIQGIIKHGPTAFKQIRKDYLKDWTETEIRLRICKLLRFYNLKDYEGTVFTSEEQILAEAKKNKEEASRLDQESIKEQIKNAKSSGREIPVDQVRARDQKLVGGIYFNPPSLKEINKEHEGQTGVSVISNFFAKAAEKKDELMKNEEN